MEWAPVVGVGLAWMGFLWRVEGMMRDLREEMRIHNRLSEEQFKWFKNGGR